MISGDQALGIACLDPPPAIPRPVRIGRERRAAGYRLRPADWNWEQATVQVTLGGEGAVWYEAGDEAVAIPRGRALVYHNRSQRELVYGCAAQGRPWEFLYVNLLGAAATAVIAELAARGRGSLPVDPRAALWRDLRALLPPPGSFVNRLWSLARCTVLAQRVLLAISGGIDERQGEADERHLLVEQAMGLVAERLDEPWTVERLARGLGVGREHLTRVFSDDLGLAPATWLRQTRIERAMQLLLGGGRVKTVARLCGFADPAHFAAVFRKQVGMGPRDFRRSGGAVTGESGQRHVPQR